jgi:hypothetical protein
VTPRFTRAIVTYLNEFGWISIFTEHAFYAAHIGLVYGRGATQLTLTFRGHFGKDMALESAFALETGSGFLDAL